MVDRTTYGWRTPSLSYTPNVPRDMENLADDVAVDLALSAPDPNVLGASNGSGAGVQVTGNYVTGSMGELLVVPGSLQVPAGDTALIRADLRSDYILSPGNGATSHLQYSKDGGAWTPTSWIGAWGSYGVNSYGSGTERVAGRSWNEYLNLDSGTYTFRMAAGSNSGAQVKCVLYSITIVLLTIYPPGVVATVPPGGTGTTPPDA